MSTERFSGEFVDFGYVGAEPLGGCGGVIHEVVSGVLGDPFLAFWEFSITHQVVHDRVPDSCDVLVSLFIECFVFCSERSIIDWFDECFSSAMVSVRLRFAPSCLVGVLVVESSSVDIWVL